MNINAGNLQARNIGQLVQCETNGDTLMGRLERIKLFRNDDGVIHKVAIRVSGDTLQCDADARLSIWRSPELAAMVRMRHSVDELADDLFDYEHDDLDLEVPGTDSVPAVHSLEGAAA